MAKTTPTVKTVAPSEMQGMVRPVLVPMVDEVRYHLGHYLKFCIFRSGDEWVVAELSFFTIDPNIRLMDGTRGGGRFKTFTEAESELERIMRYMETDLTRKEIMRHFVTAWIKKEEQATELFAFRKALLEQDFKIAKKIYVEDFGNYTREAIPDKVKHQISLHL